MTDESRLDERAHRVDSPDWGTAHALEPVTILPVQLAAGSTGRHTPEQLLAAAVLRDAIHSFQKYCFGRDRRSRRLFREVEEWLMREDTDWPFSCENICAALGLDLEYLRRALRHWQLHVAWHTRAQPPKRRGLLLRDRPRGQAIAYESI
jgi:hypothetical protein